MKGAAMKRLRSLLVLLLLLAIIAAGAVYAIIHFNLLGTRQVNVHGVVTRDGRPLEYRTDYHSLSVLFIPEPREQTSPLYPAKTDPDTGRFDIKNIPAGTYKVALQQLDHAAEHDVLKMVYDPSSTNLVVEVASDGQEIPIDIPRVLPKRSTPPPGMPAAAQARQPARPEETKGDDKGKDAKKAPDQEAPD